MSDHATNNAKGWAETLTLLLNARDTLAEAGRFDDWSDLDLEQKGEIRTAFSHASIDLDTDDDLSDLQEQLEEHMREMPLSVQVRTGWYTPGAAGSADEQPAEFEILLTTGGPALRITGDLDDNAQPYRARLQWQDWGTPWTDYAVSEDILDAYAALFYFGENA